MGVFRCRKQGEGDVDEMLGSTIELKTNAQYTD
jgi:hypothetical protein